MVLSLRKAARRLALLPAAAAVLLLCLLRTPDSAPAARQPGTQLRVVMYHGLTQKKSETGRYVIEADLFRRDLEYFRRSGYTVVSMQQVYDAVAGSRPLPERAVLLTFDDGLYSVYLYAYPLLEEYDACLLFAPIGRVTDQYTDSRDRNPSYAYCGWQELREMQRSGRVEIAGHSYDCHSIGQGAQGIAPRRGETQAAWRLRIAADLGRMQQTAVQQLGAAPRVFVYPFGAVPPEGDALLREAGFTATFGCESRMNFITQDPACLYKLGRWLRPPHTDSAAFYRSIWKET
ncbi:MAG: polysaccharide deacetylase family protein [Clostridia bacterium]|nr:polysaccharide deacetylase family protein [Clostridia bacterium]